MNNPKILLADDSATVRKVVELTFADEGFDVTCVADGDAAMEKFIEISPDCVIADVNMPGLGGYQLCEMIKGDESTRDIPVVLVVGSFEPFDAGEASRVGANYYFTKPFQSIRELIEKVSDLIAAKDFSSVVAPGTEDIENLYTQSIVEDDDIAVEDEFERVYDDEPTGADDDFESAFHRATAEVSPEYASGAPLVEAVVDFEPADLSVNDIRAIATAEIEQPEVVRSEMPPEDETIEVVTTEPPVSIHDTVEDAFEYRFEDDAANDDSMVDVAETEPEPVEEPASVENFAGGEISSDDADEQLPSVAEMDAVILTSPLMRVLDEAAGDDELIEEDRLHVPEPVVVSEKPSAVDPFEAIAHINVPVEPRADSNVVKFAFADVAEGDEAEDRHVWPDVSNGNASADDTVFPPALIEQLVSRVMERLSDKAVRDVAREAVPRIADTLIREALAAETKDEPVDGDPEQ